MIEQAIHFNNVAFEVNQSKIIPPLTSSFFKGKITTLIGPSGAGKTTLLKLCNGLISATSGTIYINGQPMQSYEPTTIRRIVGIALQSAPILKSTVYSCLPLDICFILYSNRKACSIWC